MSMPTATLTPSGLCRGAGNPAMPAGPKSQSGMGTPGWRTSGVKIKGWLSSIRKPPTPGRPPKRAEPEPGRPPKRAEPEPGQGQARPVPYYEVATDPRSAYRVRAGLAPALASSPVLFRCNHHVLLPIPIATDERLRCGAVSGG